MTATLKRCDVTGGVATGVKVALLLSATLLILSSCFSFAGKKKTAPKAKLDASDIRVGMSHAGFSTIFPAYDIPRNGQWNRSGQVAGLKGEWTYSFYQGRLSWFLFSSSENKVNDTSFQRFLKATRAAIKDYTERYGKPRQEVAGVLQFRDPHQGYPGYPVLKAEWRPGSESLLLDFSVLGRKHGHPKLLFTIEGRR